MTVAVSDPVLPALLPSRNEPLSLDVTTDPLNLSITLLFDNGLWDVAYQDGAFSRGYSNSTRAGSHFEIIRVGGWPEGSTFTVKVKEAPVVIPPPTVPLLTPTELSPWAQWSLDRSHPLGVFGDRSGNSRNLTGSSLNFLQGPDLRSGSHTHFISIPSNNIATTSVTAVGTLIDGPFTFCGRAWMDTTHTPTQNIISADGYRLLYVDTGATDRLGHKGYQIANALSTLTVTDGAWFWWSIRRASQAATTVRIQLNNVFQDVSTVSASLPVTYTRISIGCALSFSGEYLGGGVADVSCWASYLTDAKMLEYRAISMGL